QANDFERVDGRFEHDGVYYKLVKHKLQNDTLHIICIRDYETRQLVNTMTDYAELVQTLPGTDPGQKALNYLSKLIKDYCSQGEVSLIHQSGYSMELQFAERPELLLQTVIPVSLQPPRDRSFL